MSSLLSLSEWAIDYAANTVRIKTGNRFEGINRLQNEKKNVNDLVKRSRRFVCETYRNLENKTPLDEVFLRSQVAKFKQSGNCTEQSAIAFEYLYDRGVRGIGWMAFPDHDHMLTVLGLTVRPPKDELFRIGEGPPASWSTNAVVCDPWYHEWFVAALDWDRKIPHILHDTTGSLLAGGTECIVQCRAYA